MLLILEDFVKVMSYFVFISNPETSTIQYTIQILLIKIYLRYVTILIEELIS
jgi:hypothetical protein